MIGRSAVTPMRTSPEPEPPRPITFEEFFDRERNRLFGAMCLITGSRHEAEEVTQDAFVSMWERWERVRGLEDPTGYLYRTAMNAFRKRARRASLAVRRAVGLTPPRDEIAAADARRMVMLGLAALTPRQRAALVLTDLLEYSSEEAGGLLGVRPGTVRALAHQGRAAMRKRMESNDE